MRSDSPRKVDFTVTITPNQEPQVLLPGNHQLETWEKWLEVSRAVAYFFGSLLFLFGSIFFYPEYSAKWNGNAVVFASWGFVIGCIYFFAGANLDFIQSIRYNHGTQLRQVLRAFTALCNYMAASTFVLGALYFLPSWYPKSPELGCWAFINGCILFCIGAIVEILFICTTHGDPRVSGFRITNMFCWGAAATLSTLVSSVFFIIGSWFYLPEYINRADDGTHYMNTAITFYVLGSVCFVVNSCVLALGDERLHLDSLRKKKPVPIRCYICHSCSFSLLPTIRSTVLTSSPIFSLRTPLILLLGLVLLATTTTTVHSLDQATQVEEVELDPDVGKSTVELIQARGYAVETHNVTTADGYILTLHRLPMSYAETQSGESAAANKTTILLMHGLLDSSFSWVCNFRNQSFAFVLADAGYDVWLGNNRGNTYSDRHIKYTTEDDAFWDFSWEDMGRFDLPAMLNHALEVSGRDTLALVGHSEGTTQAFVAFSENQTLAQSVSYFAALVPVAWLGHTKAKALKFVAKIYLDKIFDVLGQVEFLSQNEVLQEIIGASACTLNPQLCETALALVSGDSENWNSSRVAVYLSEMPAGTSVKNMAHYAQSIRKDTFSAYNYDCSCLRPLGLKLCSKLICKNKAKYGSFDPPAFPVANVKYPRTGFFRGENDILATSVDIDQLRTAMPLSTVVYDETISDFSHMDFTWAVNANDKVYQSVLEQLEAYAGVGY
ncbi:hypothetical protein PF005_g4747 [Phytophthora fragariae]|uniref:Partial AB-hydrolase lipase domain-containing protein n=1 Tax=Phytophthora fragariae TaxID=53985 RepID=A0A6A3T563_9STRA|nr:hypothetical protein PF007_g4784 [Phytophthora fragariae]KAE9227395.1 hypothetical protein PF005_g4747 [Phytophthora fragariae]